MSWVAVGSAAVTVVGGAISSNQEKHAQKDAAKAANAAQNQAWAANNANMQPYLTAGQNALTQIQQLNAGNMSSFNESPDYTWTRDQGIGALDRSAAANGSLYSGGHSADLLGYASGLASQNYGTYVNRLLNIAGMGQSAAGALAGVNTGYANAVGTNNANAALANGANNSALTGLVTGIGSNLLSSYGAGTGRTSAYGANSAAAAGDYGAFNPNVAGWNSGAATGKTWSNGLINFARTA